MKGALDVHRELLAHDIPHEIVRLPRVVLHADELPDALRLPPAQCVSTRIYYIDDVPTAITVPTMRTAEPAGILAALDAMTLRPATSEQTNALTRYAAGLVCPALLPADITLYVDAGIDPTAVIYMPTGDTGTALGIVAAVFFQFAKARAAHFVDAPIIELPRDLSRLRL